MTPLDALILFITGALCVIAIIACVNALTFPRLKPHPSLQEGEGWGKVYVLIPARDEADVIADTVRAMVAQTHADFTLILLDDGSTDDTAGVARRAANGDPRLQIIAGTPLPSGWLGKNWACQQLATAAKADIGDAILIFCDADVQWTSDALAALLAEMERTDRAGRTPDLLTVWSTQTTITWGERLVVPLMALVILGYLPAPLVHYTPFPVFAAANGQCLAFRRRAYDAIGGHAAVKASIIDDIALARRIKACGCRLRMADGAGVIGCRMYRDWAGVRDGYAKNIIAGYGSVGALLLATVFHYAIFFLPFVWALAGWELGAWDAAIIAAWIILGLGVRALTAAVTRQRIGDAIFMPVSVLLMTVIAARAIYWRVRYGGARWKGRTIPRSA
jgi:chlorobactene glucosyltransferase